MPVPSITIGILNMEENKEINQELNKETNQEIKKVILGDMEIAENSEDAMKKDDEENERKQKIIKRLHFSQTLRRNIQPRFRIRRQIFLRCIARDHNLGTEADSR